MRQRVCASIMSVILGGGILSDLGAQESLEGTDLEAVEALSELSLEQLALVEVDVVYSASKYEQDLSEAPSAVTIITAEEIRLFGFQTLADILRSVRGFYINNDRNYEYLGNRGFARPGDYNSRFLILIDGMRINENVGDSGPIGREFPLDVQLIDRVEIIRGPGSSLYGSNALFGVIDVRTKDGADLGGFELSASLGSFDSIAGRVTWGREFESGLDVLVSTSRFRSGGQILRFPEFESEGESGFIDYDGERAGSFFSKVSVGEFVFEAGYQKRRKEVPTAAFETIIGDERFQSDDDQGFVQGLWRHEFSETLESSVKVGYSRYEFQGRFPYDYADPGEDPFPVLNREEWIGSWWGAEWMFVSRSFDSNTLTWGAEYRRNLQQDQENYDLEVYLDDEQSSNTWGIFAQDEWVVNDQLSVTAGLRFDDYDSFGSTTNPRVAIVYHPTDSATLKGVYGTAFRAPNAYELYYDDGETAKANPDLDPEQIVTYEAIWTQELSSVFESTLSAFYYDVDDLITQAIDEDDDLAVFQNVGKATGAGVEAQLDARWDSGVRGRLSYTFADTENGETDRRLANSPRHVAQGRVLAPIAEGALYAGVEGQYVGEMRGFTGEVIDDFFLFHLTMTSQYLDGNLELRASIRNLLDASYDNPGSLEHIQTHIEQNGRSFLFELTYRF